MELPLILVNFKTYEETAGDKGLKLAKTCEKVSKKYKITIAVSPQHQDLKDICSKVKIPVFAQHIDPIDSPGAHTGSIIATNLKEIGVKGTLINHAERRMKLEDIKKCVDIARANNLISVCCASSLEEVGKIIYFNPDFIAFEDPTLIGTLQSVSKLQPETVKRFAFVLKNSKTIPLCGAGVANGDDVKSALKLGTKGVLVAKAVDKAEKPEQVLTDFARAAKIHPALVKKS